MTTCSTLGIILALLPQVPQAIGSQAQPDRTIVLRWSNVAFAIRADPQKGVSLWAGATPQAMDAGGPSWLRSMSFRPHQLDEWLPFAQSFLAGEFPIDTPSTKTRTSAPLPGTHNELLAIAEDRAAPSAEPGHLIYVADSGGKNPLVARTTREHLQDLLLALKKARAQAGWGPDTASETSDPKCPQLGYIETRCTPVILRPGAQLQVPGIAMRGVGEVWAQYMVDESGRADLATLDIIYSDHRVLASAVRKSLPHFKYQPATTHGVPVRQLVYQRFRFNFPAGPP
jgi:hypothetical protein